jgi:hypothetical protein
MSANDPKSVTHHTAGVPGINRHGHLERFGSHPHARLARIALE